MSIVVAGSNMPAPQLILLCCTLKSQTLLLMHLVQNLSKCSTICRRFLFIYLFIYIVIYLFIMLFVNLGFFMQLLSVVETLTLLNGRMINQYLT